MQATSVKNIDNKHTEWKNTLGFYRDELNVFRKRLEEIAEKNNGKEVMSMVEHFQNQFLVQSEIIDVLQHDINEHISLVAREAIDNTGHINRDQIAAHFSLQERQEREIIIFKDLKNEFMGFLSKVM